VISMAVQKSLLFSLSPTFAEYLAGGPAYADLLRARRREIRLSANDQSFFSAYPDIVHVVAIIAEDSPDTPAVLPVLAHIAAQCPRMDLRVLREEDAPGYYSLLSDDQEFLDSLPTLDVPLVVFFDEEWQIQDRWGPQPQAIEPYLEAWLERNPEYELLADDNSPEAQTRVASLAEQLAAEMRLWYNSGLNQACAAEIRDLLAGLNEDLGKDSGMEAEAGA
jgi:hypothetical protein